MDEYEEEFHEEIEECEEDRERREAKERRPSLSNYGMSMRDFL